MMMIQSAMMCREWFFAAMKVSLIVTVEWRGSLAGWVGAVGCRRRRQKIRRQTLHWWQSVRRLSRYINWTLLSCLKVSVQRTRSNKHTQSVQCLYFFAVQFCIFCVLGFSGYTETQCLCLSVCSVIVVMRLPTQTDCLLVSLSVCLSVSLCASISLSVCLSVSVEILSWWDCLPRPTVCLSRQTEGPTWTRWHRFWWQLFTRYCSQTTSARTRSVSLSVCLSLSLSLCVSLSLSVCLSLSLSVCVTLSLSLCLSLSVCVSLSLSVCHSWQRVHMLPGKVPTRPLEKILPGRVFR